MNAVREYPFYLKATIILAGIMLFVHGLMVAKSIVVPLVLSAIMAVMLIPTCEGLERRKIPRPIASFISVLILMLILITIAILTITQFRRFANDIPDLQILVEQVAARAYDLLLTYSPAFMQASIRQLDFGATGMMEYELTDITWQFLSTVGGFTLYFIIPIFIFFFLLYRDFINTFMVHVFSKGDKHRLRILADKMKKVLQSYVTGMFIVICILAVLNSILLLSLGVRHAILFAVFAAVLNIIPFLGPIFGSVVPAIYALLTMDSLWIPFLVILGFYIIQLFESNLFTPVIVGDKVSLNPMVTIIAILAGGYIWGLLGMILFIPGLAIVKLIFDEIDDLKPYGFLLGRVDKNFKRVKWRRVPGFRETIDKQDNGIAGETAMKRKIREARDRRRGKRDGGESEAKTEVEVETTGGSSDTAGSGGKA